MLTSSTTIAASPDRDDSARSEVSQFFVSLARAIGFPKSVGEIFGTLYCSPSALSFNDLVERSGTSKASVSQGLRMLKNINAIREVDVATDRRTYYRAVLQVRHLLEGFIRETIEPQLRRGAINIAQLQHQADPIDPFLSERIAGLREWNRATSILLQSLFRAPD